MKIINETENVPNYLALAIVSTLCCFLPTGIVSIVYACKANSLLAVKDLYGAKENSKKAKMWALISIALAVVIWLAYLIFIVFLSAITAVAEQ